MALIFMDSFDDRTSANTPYKWESQGTTVPNISSTYGRNGQGLYIANDGNITPRKVLDTTQNTWIFGYAFKVPNATFVQNWNFLFFWDNTNYQLYLMMKTDGAVEIHRGDGTLLATTSASFTPNEWQYFEIKYKISNTVGTVEIRRNGVSVGTYSGDTQNTANAYATHMMFAGGGGNGMYVDDVYLCDGSGSDTFRGDCKVECLFPISAGALTQWTPSAGSNYQNVDDPVASAPAPDGDSTYNSSGTPGNLDTFVYGNLATVGKTVLGVQIDLTAQKVNAGTRHIETVIRQGGSNYLSSEIGVSQGYTTYMKVYETNPHTGVAWTTTDINTNAEFGYGDES